MIGLGSYAFFWQRSDRVEAPLDLPGAFEATRALDVELFQICDDDALESMSVPEARTAARVARDLGLTVQLGTKGVDTARLSRFLDLALAFDARLVRTMVHGPSSRPSMDEAEALLRAVLPAYRAAGVALTLETYEQIATADLVELVERLDFDGVGICLDPANVVARLEDPRRCVALAAPYVTAVHVKDFAFSRAPGWVGFQYSGAPMGSGLHDYAHLLATVRPRERGIDEVVEHWLPWQGDAETTIRAERAWTRRTIDHLRGIP